MKASLTTGRVILQHNLTIEGATTNAHGYSRRTIWISYIHDRSSSFYQIQCIYIETYCNFHSDLVDVGLDYIGLLVK